MQSYRGCIFFLHPRRTGETGKKAAGGKRFREKGGWDPSRGALMVEAAGSNFRR